MRGVLLVLGTFFLLAVSACSTGISQEVYDDAVERADDLEERVEQAEDELAQQQTNGTYYESLSLDSPEEAVIEFAGAFGRDDYLTVYLIFGPSAQREVVQSVQLFQFSDLVQDFDDSWFDELPGLDDMDHPSSAWAFFDEAMGIARRHDAFVIDLRGSVRIVDESPGPDVDAGKPSVDIVARARGLDGDLVFRMVQAPSGDWRVHQVIMEGGDTGRVPWAVPDR